MSNMGCFLEVVENKRLVFTDALLPGFRPAAKPESGARLIFTDEIDRQKHADMGFHQGWGIALDQLIKEVSR